MMASLLLGVALALHRSEPAPGAVPAPTTDPPSAVVPAAYESTSPTGDRSVSPAPDGSAASGPNSPPAKPYRRGLPPALDSPPFPSAEWQGYPLVGVAPDTTHWPLQKSLQGTYLEDFLDS